tara:strand:+ start:1296 stop:1457 length:162 start_codon:yes stop_codon:yes gene_type:complete
MNLKSIFLSVVAICFTSIIFGISIISLPADASCLNNNEKDFQVNELNEGKINE